jgi:hypothetical protein
MDILMIMMKLINILKEVNYKDFLSKDTMKSLDAKSKESLKSLLGNKNLMQTMMRSSTLLPEIIRAEQPYIHELEQLAVEMVKEMYPIIDYVNIRIDAKIVPMGQINLNNDEAEEPFDADLPSDAMMVKRRVINGLTQGASVRGAFGFMMFKEALDQIDPSLLEKYNEILKLSFGIYDNEEAIALMLQLLAQGQKIEGGSSDMEYDEEHHQFVIKAQAVCFPMLVHEIIKGLYEIVGTEGFSGDKEKNKDIINKIDRLDKEPRDLQYGKFIYDALNNLYIDSDVDDARIRELLFAEIYKLDDQEFLNFIENAVNGRLDNNQKLFVKNTIRDIERDLKKDDTHLDDLDEVKIGGRADQLALFLTQHKNEVIDELAEYMEAEELEDTENITFTAGDDDLIKCAVMMDTLDGETSANGFAFAYKPSDFGEIYDEEDTIEIIVGNKKIYVLTYPI